MSKRLVAYFSASGVTRKAAETLAEATGADLYEIRPEIPYSRDDLNWNNKTSRSSVEMNDKSCMCIVCIVFPKGQKKEQYIQIAVKSVYGVSR